MIPAPPFDQERSVYSFCPTASQPGDIHSENSAPNSDCSANDDVHPSQSQSQRFYHNRNPTPLILPSLFDPSLIDDDDSKAGQDLQPLRASDPAQVLSYFRSELSVSRLNRIHKHLWIAGLERPARAIHHQILIGRKVAAVDDANLHLLWIDGKVFVKPLPEFLLCWDVWEGWLKRRGSESGRDRKSDGSWGSEEGGEADLLWEAAVGMLLSYIWLVRSRTDLRIAHSEGLLPEQLSWEQWTSLTASALNRIDYKTFRGMNPRYRYGELRLNRINWCWSFCSKTRTVSSMARGYMNKYHGYRPWFRQHIAWVSGATIYVVLVLTAMQVGLATDNLRGSNAFQRASFGFTIFSILAPLGVITSIISIMLVLVLWNLRYTLGLKRRREYMQRSTWENGAIKKWAH